MVHGTPTLNYQSMHTIEAKKYTKLSFTNVFLTELDNQLP